MSSGSDAVESLGGWLTTVVGRVCLDMLRSRTTRREDPLHDEDERLAFVLHDLFAVPFDEIAPVLGRTAAATRQLASRGRRRVQGGAPAPDPDPGRLRVVVDAFLAASRGGDFAALVDVLGPEVVARSDGGALLPPLVRRGAAEVASQAITFARLAEAARPVLLNGLPGVVAPAEGRAMSVMAFTVRDGRIIALDILTDPRHGASSALGDPPCRWVSATGGPRTGAGGSAGRSASADPHRS
ncbi:sigma factor-like helix-turn-helix DNA-binding protein [Streptomyces virginiae]|uniref:sigma factor-like helix-turn-helix DNA-binding protein n=1 Tax=Streptomyces virginiae TaxID=1961 RepID=UPI0036B0F01A